MSPPNPVPPRIVSLVPSVTETLLAWNITPLACTRFCEQPKLTHVGGTKNPDIAAIVALAPDLVVMERDENRLEDHQALSEQGIRIEVLEITSLASAQSELERLAASITGTGQPAPNRPAPSRPVPGHPAPGPRAPAALTAFVPIWRKPWITINHDTYAASLLAQLGVAVAFADHPQRYPTIAAADIAAAAVDVVLAPTEPYPFAERHLAELSQFAPAELINGQDLFWWGARTPAALKRLAADIKRIARRLP